MEPSAHTPAPRRALYLILAALFLALGVLGVFLPILPTTPFLLLTSWCLVRSSPRLDARLRATRFLGPLIDDWERHRALRPATKVAALSGLALGVALSLALADLAMQWVVLLLVIAGTGAVYVLRIPTRR